MNPSATGQSGISIWQDDHYSSAAEIHGGAEALAERLASFRGERVGLVASSAEAIIKGILGAQQADVSLVLLRSLPHPCLPAEWQISALLCADGSLQAIEGTQPAHEGFHLHIATSGTTGTPKIARHTWENLTGRIRLVGDTEQRWLLTYHPAAYGGLQVILTALLGGYRLLACSQLRVPGLVEIALRQQPTHASGTPTFWRSFLATAGQAAQDIPLRQITLGGEIADQGILDRLQRTYPAARITHIYASTEAGSLFAVRDGKAGFPAVWLETGIDDVRLRIRERVLEALSPRSMVTYTGGQPDPRVEDGWLRTGDLVEQRGDRVVFLGREDAMLSVGGAKVRPEEVEEVLLSLPGVAEARVYGVPNPISGFFVGADVVAKPGADTGLLRTEILSGLRQRLEPFKMPRRLTFVDEIPTSAGGKKRRSQ